MTILAYNRKAKHEYKLTDKYEAGLVLSGQEVKSVKTGHISLKGSFVTIKGNEMYLTNANIPPYKHAGEIKDYNPTQPRKLLLRKPQIMSLIGKSKARGLTLVPIRVYTKKSLIKLEFALGRGKKQIDKREDIKRREARRKTERLMKS